jgi:hypothetical protein
MLGNAIIVNPGLGEPPTGEPDAGDPLVRFRGRGSSRSPYPIIQRILPLVILFIKQLVCFLSVTATQRVGREVQIPPNLETD